MLRLRWVETGIVSLVCVMALGCGSEPPPSTEGSAEDPGADVVPTDASDPLDGEAAEDAGETPGADTADSGGDAPIEPDPAALLAVDGDPNFAVASAGWYRGDLHYHTDFSDDAKEQGGDPLPVCIDIADAYRHPDYLAVHPERANDGLDFIAITDHRTDLAISDPGFTHEHLILLPGEEYGGSGHANIWGLQQHIDHNSQRGESQNDRHNDAIAEAHEQGAVFSINHPLDRNAWNWDTPEVDAVEVVNGMWAGFSTGMSEEEYQSVLDRGTMTPALEDAYQSGGPSLGDQSLRFWHNLLSSGVHAAIVGGSDRHMFYPAGLPTTYVRKPDGEPYDALVGPALGSDGVVEGIRRGGTFVSRSPFAAQVDLRAEAADGTAYPMGAELPAGQAPWTIHIEVSRADGGRVRLLEGSLGGPGEPARVVFDEPVSGARVTGTFEWTPPEGGGWLHAFVWEPIPDVAGLPPHLQDAAEVLSQTIEGEPFINLVAAILPMVEGLLAFDPSLCNKDEWDPTRPLCMTVDVDTLTTFYLPEELVALINRIFDDADTPTDYCMGAISSAFLVR